MTPPRIQNWMGPSPGGGGDGVRAGLELTLWLSSASLTGPLTCISPCQSWQDCLSGPQGGNQHLPPGQVPPPAAAELGPCRGHTCIFGSAV